MTRYHERLGYFNYGINNYGALNRWKSSKKKHCLHEAMLFVTLLIEI
jgi:hypothetical protein